MQELETMRQEMQARKARAQANQDRKVEIMQKAAMVLPTRPTIGRVLEKTPVQAAKEIRATALPTKSLTKAQTEALVKGGRNVLAEPIPKGYQAVSSNERDVAEAYIKIAWALKVLSFDFETNADQDEGVDILRDEIVGMSAASEEGTALYFPVAHDNYGANWDVEELISLFKPLWESVDVLKIAYNIK